MAKINLVYDINYFTFVVLKRKTTIRPLTTTLFFIILTCITSSLSAQTTITGKVTDKKHPLIGASITLKDTYDGATSDSSGKYSFKTSEKGEFILMVTSVGYVPVEQTIKLEGKGTLTIDIVLKEYFPDESLVAPS